jgi:hypothetical protein
LKKTEKKGGAFLNGKEGRVGFRKADMIIGRRSINNNNFKATFSVDVEPTFKKQDK